MRGTYLLTLIVILISIEGSLPALAAEDAPTKSKQFIYILRLVPRLHDDKAWTKEDTMALDRHVARFRHAIETGELILAGRTQESGDKTLGIAIFYAPNETAARQFMESDPAVVAGLMTAELRPFAVVFERNKP
jgi:uncharacterized protein YciI